MSMSPESTLNVISLRTFCIRGVKDAAPCTIEVQFVATQPFGASIVRVGRLQGAPGAVDGWFNEKLTALDQQGLHESISFVEDAPVPIVKAGGNGLSGLVRLTIPAEPANHYCYRVDLSPSAQVQFFVDKTCPPLRFFTLVHLSRASASIAAAADADAAPVDGGDPWPQPTPPPPPTQR